MIVPLFWICPLSTPVTATAWVVLARPAVVVLLIVPPMLFVMLPVPESTTQGPTPLLLAGATTGRQPAASAPELRPTIIAVADAVVIRRCRIRSRLRCITFPPSMDDATAPPEKSVTSIPQRLKQAALAADGTPDHAQEPPKAVLPCTRRDYCPRKPHTSITETT